MKETAVSFETSVHFYQTVPRQMLRHNIVHIHGREENKSRGFSIHQILYFGSRTQYICVKGAGT